MIKRLLALTLALLMVLAAFAACKPNKEVDSEAVVTEPPASEPAETIALDFNPATTKVALLIGNQSLPANRYAAHGFLRTAENLGYPAILYAADDSQAAAARVDEAIAAEGSSFDGAYRTVLGLEGGFLAVNSMYGRAGEPCKGCGSPVQKIKLPGLIGRPTHLCPTCQPLRPRASRSRSKDAR